MKTLNIRYKLLTDSTTVKYGTIDVEDWWTDCFIIDEFWNRMGRKKINKMSIDIIRTEEYK